MVRILWLAFTLVWGSVGLASAQTSPASAAAKAPAPLPDESTLKISETPSTPSSAAKGPSTDITIWDFVKMIVILALVLAMIWGVVWFLRRLSGQGPGTDAAIKILHTQSLGGGKILQVVEVADQVLLLGLGDGGIRLVKDLSGTEAGDTFRLAASEGRTRQGTPKFSDLLGSILGLKPKIRPDVKEPVEKSSDFLKKQRERLKKL